ncbi:MAG: PRC-barrel domain-containing protein [Alphaproteobacteria bacterium]|nr:PRC-barrel domain-containing protein [Alphaproteobacteria bacterium]
MKIQFLATVSLLTLATAVPCHAADTQARENAPATSQTFSKDADKAWEDTKENVSEAADQAGEAAKDAYENIKAAVIGENEGQVTTVTIDSRTTAAGMIGQPVYNVRNEKIATIRDIIVNAGGEATTVVVADGGVFGFGAKLAAFDYNLVSQRQQNGDVIMPLSEETIKKAAEFSYDRKDIGKADVRVIPDGSLSVATLLKGQIVNPQNETVAEVDNISFEQGSVKNIIVAFDQTLGMGGKKAAVPYDDVKLVRQDNDNDNVDFQLSANQATQFENFKKTATN